MKDKDVYWESLEELEAYILSESKRQLESPFNSKLAEIQPLWHKAIEEGKSTLTLHEELDEITCEALLLHGIHTNVERGKTILSWKNK